MEVSDIVQRVFSLKDRGSYLGGEGRGGGSQALVLQPLKSATQTLLPPPKHRGIPPSN